MSDLFTYTPQYPDAPGFKDTDTSLAAAESMKDRAPLLRARCLVAIALSGGLTADEVAAKIGESVLSVRPRLTEILRDGKIEDTGERRKNESGRSAKVWRAIR